MTPAVARASAGAVEHLPIAVVQNLARYLNDVKGPTSGSGGGLDGGTPLWKADLDGGVALSSAPKAGG